MKGIFIAIKINYLHCGSVFMQMGLEYALEYP